MEALKDSLFHAELTPNIFTVKYLAIYLCIHKWHQFLGLQRPAAKQISDSPYTVLLLLCLWLMPIQKPMS